MLPVPPLAPIPAIAVTFAVRVAVNTVDATPLPFVVAEEGLTAPVSTVNATFTPGSTLPEMSSTIAEIVEVPPPAGKEVGLAVTPRLPTAALPTAILSTLAVATAAPPEAAVMVAVPLARPALNITMARPLMSVSASVGSMVPSVVTKIRCVPECGGVPEGSSTWAMSWAEPLVERQSLRTSA